MVLMQDWPEQVCIPKLPEKHPTDHKVVKKHAGSCHLSVLLVEPWIRSNMARAHNGLFSKNN